MHCIPNQHLKHTNPHFSIGKTEVTRRADCNPGPYWAPKSTTWAPSSFKIVYENKQFQPHSGQRAVLRCSNALHSQSAPKTHESSHFHIKNGGYPEEPLSRLTLLSTKIHLAGPLFIQNSVQKQALAATQRPKSRSEVLQCIAFPIIP